MIALLTSLIALADPSPGLSPEAVGGVPGVSLDTPVGVSVFTRTGVEGLPTLSGDPGVRFAERLGLDVRGEDGWRASVRGGIRLAMDAGDQPPGSAPWTGDLWRASLSWTGHDRALSVGRQVRLDARGFQRLDGISGRLLGDGPIAWQGWLGRRWHPEVARPRNAWVGGVEATVDLGERSRPELVVGFEGREALDDTASSSLDARAWGQLRVRSVYGRRASLLVEGNRAGNLRARLDGSTAVGRRVDLGAEARWEDLPPSTAFDQPRAPLTWLAPDGYGTGTVRIRWTKGGWAVLADGGPSVRHPGKDGGEVIGGGLAQLTLARSFGLGELAVYGMSAGIGRARLSGGGLGVDLGDAAASVRVQGAAWHLRPLDQDPAMIAEVRGIGHADVARLGADLNGGGGLVLGLSGQVAAGSDRQLKPFVRAGLAITGRWSQAEAP